MFARKGTRRKQLQSIRQAIRASLPIQAATSDPEIGKLSAGDDRVTPTAPSITSSTLTLNEEKSLVDKSSGFLRHESYQTVNYGSVLLQLVEAQLESSNMSDFLQRVWEIVWQSFVMTVVLLVLSILPVSMVAMGTSYLEECPKEPRVPVYLLVGGAFGLIYICMLLWQQKRLRDSMLLDDSKLDPDNDERDVMTRSNQFTLYLLSFFLVIWFTLGNYWLLSIWQPNFSQPLHEPRNWCSYRLYYYTFYQIVACYSLAGVTCLVVIGCLLTYLWGVRRK